MTLHRGRMTLVVSLCALGVVTILAVSLAMAQDESRPTAPTDYPEGQGPSADEPPTEPTAPLATPAGDDASGQPAPQDPADEDTPTPAAGEPATSPTEQPQTPELADDEGQPDGTGESLVEQIRPGAFMVNFHNTDLRLALRMLSTQGRRNIIAGRDITGSVTATFYEVTFEEALDAILRMNGYVYRQEDNFIYVYTPEQLAEGARAAENMVIRVFRLSYMTAADAEVLIAPLLSEDGSVALTPAAGMGIGGDPSSAGGNSYATEDIIVVRDYERNVEQIAEIIEQLDVRPDQVLIEATILSILLDEDNDLGVNFSTLAGIDFESLGSTSTGVGNMSAGSIASEDLQGLRAAQFGTGFSTFGSGMSIGFLSNNVSVFISALESITDLTVLANPKLLVVNKQRGEVVVGRRDGYRTTVVNQGISTETIEFLETGTRLVVRPYIGRDSFVRLEIHPEDSNGSIANGLPSETTTEVTSNVLVRDGHTIVIGGLFREETQEVRTQIPILGNFPGVGALFRTTRDSIERQEVIVLITPHIIRQDADEGVSALIHDDVERFRVGQRRGLRWWGRSRLAATYMRWANEAFQRGDRQKAMWHVDMALSMDPRLLEAIRLKEELTKQAYWAGEAQVSTVQYVIQQMILQELGYPIDRLTPPVKPLNPDELDERIIEAFGIIRRVDRYQPAIDEHGDETNANPEQHN